jgi:hypothetical protein
MASMAKNVGLLFLGGALGSGATSALSGYPESRGDRTTPAVEVKKNYTEVDANTFVIKAGRDNSLESFGKSLAEFRSQQSGEFLIMPRFPEYPFNHDALAVRQNQVSEDGKQNTIVVGPGPQSVNGD